MPELLFINPSGRKAKKRTFSAKQLANQRRFAKAAKARSRATKKANPSKPARKANPMAKRRTRRSPAKRTTSRRRRTVRRSNPVKAVRRRTSRRSAVRHTSHRRRRRNPISIRSALSSPLSTLKPALIGAVGSIAVNTVISKLPLPASMKAGNMRFVTQGGIALLLGMITGKFLGAGMAAKAVEGALTVTIRDAILANVPASVGLSGMGYAGPAQIMNRRQQMGMHLPDTRGANQLGMHMPTNVTALSAMPGARSRR
jgi:hypothetical protein